MNITDFINLVIRKIWILLLSVVICVAVVGGYSLVKMEKVYESSVSIYVLQKDSAPSSNLYQDLLAGTSLIKDYRELISSRAVLDQALTRLQGANEWAKSMTVEKLAANVSVTNKNDTHIMMVKAHDTNAENASLIANEVSEAFVDFSKRITVNSSMQIIDKALTVGKQVQPKPALYMAIAAVIGVMIGLVLIYVQLLVTKESAGRRRRSRG